MEKVIKGLTKATAVDKEKKSKKRLQTFITEKNLTKKWKTLVKITEKEAGEELRRFFLEQCDNILMTINMFVGTLELAKDKTKKGHESDVMQVFEVLKKCVVVLVVQIKNRWKFPELLALIRKLLVRQNKAAVRTAGFELLLLFTEALLQAEESKEGLEEVLDLFARAINLQPFVLEQPTAVLALSPPAADPALILVPASGESSEEAIEQFHLFFEFMTARTGRSMEWWFEQFKARYLTVLYPRVMREIGYGADERAGFSERCPAGLQCALIEQLDKWKGNVPLTTRLWEDRNAPLMFEIARQVTQLPLRHAATVKRVLFTFRHWFLTKRIREEVQQSYWRLFIGHWVTLFSLDPSESPEEYRALFIELLSLYNSLSQTQMLDEPSWHTLQHSLLTGTLQLLARHKTLRARDAAVDAVAEDVVNHLFLVWLRSPYNSDEHWHTFHEQFVSVLDQGHAIRGWKDKIVRLTALLVEYYYAATDPADTEDERAPVKEPVAKDTMGVAWDEAKIKDMWFTILNICGNINNLSVPHNYETAMQCVAEMIDIFVASEHKIPLAEQPHKLPLLDIFLPWLLQACYAAPDKQQGLVIAYRVLAKLFCRQHAQPLAIDLLAHFYRVVLNGLTSEREPVRDAVLTSTRLIFSCDLPGSAVLVSAYLTELQHLFTHRTAISSEVQRSAIAVLHSLLSYPAHYSEARYPHGAQSWSAGELRERLTALLHQLLSGPAPIDGSTRQQVLWALCVHVFDELRADEALAPRMESVVRSLQLIIEHTRHRDDHVALTACEVLGCLTTLMDEFTALNQDLTYSVIALLTDNIAQLLHELLAAPAAPRDKVLNDNFATLSAWLVSQGNLFLTDPELNCKIFRLLELALLGQVGAEPTLRAEQEPRATSEEEESDKKKRKDSTRKSTLRASESAPHGRGTLPQESALERLMRQPAHGSSSVQQAAELFIATLTSYYNNFPTPAGATMMESFQEDEEDRAVEALYFAHYDRHVLALYPLADHLVRFVVRTPLGKYAWDCAVDWGDEHVVSLARTALPEPKPLAAEPRDHSPPCPLSTHLAALYAQHPEALESGAELEAAALGQPRLSAAYTAESRATRTVLEEVMLQDLAVQSRSSPHAPQPSAEPSSELSAPVSLFSCSRLLLSSLGLLSAPHRRALHQLEDSSRLRRALQDLDRVRGREVVKVGVVYVREGQERQLEILCNEEGSAEYHALLRGLGWPVEIQTHAGFKAGLAADGSNGTVAPYYANERYELVYHVVSYMPTKDSDPKQVTKKRHVGNDPVHIVWSEHKRDYDPNVIVSQFNDAHIVVYPLSSGLFRIQVFKKDKLKVIGPLQDGMLVTKRTLADLVRLTAVSAHRAVRYSQKGYEHPFAIRARYLQEAVRRYKSPRAAEDFMHRLYPLKAEHLKAGAAPISAPISAPTPSSPAAMSVPAIPLSTSNGALINAKPAPPSPSVLSRSVSIGPSDASPKVNPQVKRPPPPAVKRDSVPK